MSDKPDIDNLLELARMEITDVEKEKLENEIKGILDYVEQIQEASVDIDITPTIGTPHNVMREDTDPHESGVYTDVLMKSAPVTKDGYIKVQKIL